MLEWVVIGWLLAADGRHEIDFGYLTPFRDQSECADFLDLAVAPAYRPLLEQGERLVLVCTSQEGI